MVGFPQVGVLPGRVARRDNAIGGGINIWRQRLVRSRAGGFLERARRGPSVKTGVSSPAPAGSGEAGGVRKWGGPSRPWPADHGAANEFVRELPRGQWRERPGLLAAWVLRTHWSDPQDRHLEVLMYEGGRGGGTQTGPLVPQGTFFEGSATVWGLGLKRVGEAG